jgi:hypothetical protein
MKRIGNEMVERGYDVEFMHCSSDNNSLDGVVIPSISIALLDGTAPHVVDPKTPGAIDEIINLGDYWNEIGIRTNRESILLDTRSIGSLFARAYRYIKAAAAVYEDNEYIYQSALNMGSLNAIAYDLINKLLGDRFISKTEGRQRCLFASAITPDGLKNHLDSILIGRIFELSGSPGTGAEKVIEKVKTAALESGLHVECYYCALKPEKLEHLVIPEINASITTSNKYHSIVGPALTTIDLDEYIDDAVVGKYADTLKYNDETFQNLIDRAIININSAKTIHDKMESCYIPNMDFEAIQLCWETILARILEYAKEN